MQRRRRPSPKKGAYRRNSATVCGGDASGAPVMKRKDMFQKPWRRKGASQRCREAKLRLPLGVHCGRGREWKRKGAWMTGDWSHRKPLWLGTARNCHVSRLDCVECECQSYGGGPSSHGRRGGLEIGCKGAGLSLIRSVPTSRRAGKIFCSSRACMLAAVAAGGYLDDLSATAELMMGKSARGWRWRWSAVCVFPCLPQGIFWSPGLPGPHVLARVVLMDAKSPCLSWCLPRAADNRHVGRPERRCKRAQTFRDSGESPSGGPWRREWATHMRLPGVRRLTDETQFSGRQCQQ